MQNQRHYAHVRCTLGTVLLLMGCAAVADEINFNRDIRPILSENCYHCHGPAKEGRKAKLRLDTPEGAYAEHDGIRAIVPGDLEASEAAYRIRSEDPDDQMPPPDSHYSLTTDQIDRIDAWIKSGAPYEGHWAFVAPAQRDTEAMREIIDRVVRRKLKSTGLQGSSRAGRETLIRRLSLDLRGLPPTLAEIDAFLKDRSPNAWASWVERFLASPECAERLALDWLDVARYADTNGYSIDDHRDMWLWRDWVIQAFLNNMPYDQFMIEQLAGDLIPNASPQQKMATGFLRNSMNTHEGGTIAEEYRVAYVADKVDTVATTFMGLTMKCAQCHDHKYDPITQEDYYRFFAFFNTSSESGKGAKNGNTAPVLKINSPLQSVHAVDIDQNLARRIETLEFHRIHPELRFPVEYAQWVKDERKRPARTAPVTASGGSPFSLPVGAVQPEWIWVKNDPLPAHLLIRKAFTLRAKPTQARLFFTCDNSATLFVNGHKVSAVTLWSEPKITDLTSSLKAGENIISVDARNEGGPAGFLAALTLFFAEGPDETLVTDTHWTAQILAENTVAKHSASATNLTTLASLGKHGVAPWGKLFESDDRPALASVSELLARDAAQRTSEEQQKIATAFLRHNPDEKKFQAVLKTEIDILKKQLTAGMSTVMIMDQRSAPTAPILMRGQYDQKGETVSAGVPAVLNSGSQQEIPDRLALAHWLASDDHPLTARVAVNRYWQLLFGMGLVRTAEDFGSQGAWPSHPELLDALAVQFRTGGWDVRDLLKEIVMSGTYRQHSTLSQAMRDKDPDNRWLARAPRLRLSAELVRDNAMAISGLLNRQLGGPSVFPLQPDGLWRQVSHFGYGNPFSAQAYFDSRGKERYRRSMYTAWKRTAPPPAMAMFDAPTRETCTVRRLNTNTPLQALVLMNDPQFVDAARALGVRMMSEGGTRQHDRIQYAFRLATARSPNRKELAVLTATYERERDRFGSHPEAAAALLLQDASTAEHFDQAAYTMVASTILNLNETITRQ